MNKTFVFPASYETETTCWKHRIPGTLKHCLLVLNNFLAKYSAKYLFLHFVRIFVICCSEHVRDRKSQLLKHLSHKIFFPFWSEAGFSQKWPLNKLLVVLQLCTAFVGSCESETTDTPDTQPEKLARTNSIAQTKTTAFVFIIDTNSGESHNWHEHCDTCSDITNTLVGISGETVPEGGNLHIYYVQWWHLVSMVLTFEAGVSHHTPPPPGGGGALLQFLIFWIFLQWLILYIRQATDA